MIAKERVETSRTTCDCGKGQFVFYSCEAERWSYVDNSPENWFEMHIFCENCADKFQSYKPTIFPVNDEQERWKIINTTPNQVPLH